MIPKSVGGSDKIMRTIKNVECASVSKETDRALTSMRSSPLPRLSSGLRCSFAWRTGRAFRHVVRSGAPHALAKGIVERGRATMLPQKIGERLIRECLKISPAVARQCIERDPGLVVELNALAFHRFAFPRSLASLSCTKRHLDS